MNVKLKKIKILSPDDVLKKIKTTPFIYKLTFIFSVLTTIIVHGMGFINFFFNEDTINRWNFFTRWAFIARGGWGVDLLIRVSTWGYAVPWVAGVHVIISLSLANVVIVKVLDIQSNIFAMLSSFLVIAFPTLAFTFSFNFSMHAFSWAIFFACFAVYLTQKFKFGFILGAFSLVLSFMYQAYIGWAAGLSLMIIIKHLLFNRFNLRCFSINLGKYFLMGVSGILLYLLSVRITLLVAGVEMRAYRGLDTMGRVPFRELPLLVRRSFNTFFDFFFTNRFDTNPSIVNIIYTLTFVFIFIILAIIIYITKVKIINAVLIIILLVLLPIGLNITEVFAYATFADTNWIPQFSLIFVFLMCLVNHLYTHVQKSKVALSDSLYNTILLMKWFVVIIFIILSSQFYARAGVFYLKQYTYHARTTNFYTRLLTRIEDTEGFRRGIPLMTYGHFGETQMYNPLLGFDPSGYQFPEITGDRLLRGQFVGFTHTWQRGQTYFPVWAGVYFPDPPTIVRQHILTSEYFHNMPAWPAPGSVRVIYDVVVVRFTY